MGVVDPLVDWVFFELFPLAVPLEVGLDGGGMVVVKRTKSLELASHVDLVKTRIICTEARTLAKKI